jgi:hypothetical protein
MFNLISHFPTISGLIFPPGFLPFSSKDILVVFVWLGFRFRG